MLPKDQTTTTTPPKDQRAVSALTMAQASPQPAHRQYWAFWEAMGKLMQWQAWTLSCSIDGSLLECQFAFNWDDDACLQPNHDGNKQPLTFSIT
jgi:hypothetical protein